MSKRKKPARGAEPAGEELAVVDETPAPPPPPVPAEPDEAAVEHARPKRGARKPKAKTPSEPTLPVAEVAEVAEDDAPGWQEDRTIESPPAEIPALFAQEIPTGKHEKRGSMRTLDDLVASVKAKEPAPDPLDDIDIETTVNVSGDMLDLPGRDDLDAPTMNVDAVDLEEVDQLLGEQRKHLRGMLEALVFASDTPIKPKEMAKLSSASQKQVEDLLAELRADYSTRGIHLEEVAGGWVFRTNAAYSPFIRDLTKQRPIRLTRAQVETLAIIAYRQPVTRPEVDDVRGVDSGPVLKLLLERDLIRILGKRDEVGRPLIYGTTNGFLEFFGLNSLKDLPTLREFTELTEESREKYEEELAEMPAERPLPPDPSRPQYQTLVDAEEGGAAAATTDDAPPAPAPSDDEYEGDDDLPSDDDPTAVSRAPAAMEADNDLDDEDEDEDDDDDDDDDDDEDDDDDDDDDDE